MPLDHYVTLGRSGLRVSPFCLGAMTFGEDLGWGSSVKDSEAILDRYIELGGNFIDTANFYTKGHSEKIIGDHLGHDRQKRNRLVIATKFSGNLDVGDPNGGGSNRKSIMAACEESLRRLRTDYIDLQLIAQFRGWAPFIALQIEYSLVERTVEGELTPMAEELGLGVTPWSPLKSGVLSGKYTRKNGRKPEGRPWAENFLDEKTYEVIDALERIAEELDTTVARVALAWVQARPTVSSTIIGARTLAQLEDNLKALEVKLTPEQTAALDTLTKPKLNFPADFLELARMIHAGGTTINGQTSQLIPFGVTKKGDHY
jgi:aryl-alcohol dehydrogenase-like predicted oxidoreductase